MTNVLDMWCLTKSVFTERKKRELKLYKTMFHREPIDYRVNLDRGNKAFVELFIFLMEIVYK